MDSHVYTLYPCGPLYFDSQHKFYKSVFNVFPNTFTQHTSVPNVFPNTFTLQHTFTTSQHDC